MTAISAPPVHRNWDERKVLNYAGADHHTEEGVRISLPIYIDVPNTKRKELLNAVRTVCSQQVSTTPANTHGSISVVSSQSLQPKVEAFLGMTVDILRSVLFSRGGLAVDLLFRLQSVTGMEVVTDKDLTAAFKARQAMVKDFKKEVVFNAEE